MRNIAVAGGGLEKRKLLEKLAVVLSTLCTLHNECGVRLPFALGNLKIAANLCFALAFIISDAH